MKEENKEIDLAEKYRKAIKGLSGSNISTKQALKEMGMFSKLINVLHKVEDKNKIKT